jgi:cell division protein FtsX
VAKQLESSKQVQRYQHLDHDDAMAEFRRIFRRNQKLVHSIRPSELPESFRVDLRSRRDADAFVRRMERVDGVDEVTNAADRPTEANLLDVIHGCQGNAADVEVFMTRDATQDQVAAAVAPTQAEPGFSVLAVLSKEDALAEFRRIFSSKPELRDSMTASDLPQSIRARAPDPVPQDVLDRLGQLPGVDSVATPREVCRPIRAMLDRGITPEQLARLMFGRLAGTPA